MSQESGAEYRGLLEAAPDAMVVVDQGGAIVLLNVQAEKQFGYHRDELVGQKVKNIIPQGFAERLATDALRSTADAEAQQIGTGLELIARRKDGSEFPIEIMLSPLEGPQGILVTAAIRNISVRKAAETHLAQMEARYRGLLEAAPDAMVVVNTGGEIVLLNVQAEKRFGYHRDELLGQKVKNIIPEGFAERLIADGTRSAAEALAQQIGTGIELTGRRKDGSEFPLEIMLSPLDSPEGILVTAAIRDITARKEAVVHRLLLEEQLRQSQKMEAVGRLAGGVAHDFNNILGVIMGYGEIVRRRLPDADPLHGKVVEILRAAERAAALTRQLLAFSRKQVLQPRILDLNVVVGDMEEMLHRLIGENIALKMSLREPLGTVRADPGQLEQVLMNLVVNARDAIAGTGSILIETAEVDLDAAALARHAGARPGRYVRLAVSDTGHGMDRDTVSRIFEPFFTTKALGEGTGLGLSTVYGIVEQSGGYLDVYSEPGRGTTFKVYLPRIDGVQARRKAPGGWPAPAGSGTILLVEDDPTLRAVIQETLALGGYGVLEAGTPREALALAGSHEGPIKAVLTDVVMPEMSGRELAQMLIPLRPAAPVIYMSGYTDDAIGHHGLLDPGTLFIHKPFTGEALLWMLHNACLSRGGA